MHTQRLLASLLVCLGLLSSGTAMSETIQAKVIPSKWPTMPTPALSSHDCR